tara:strand:- start:415 stop:684 length:270 start_codon:yes stop_codon:yes gene_type:complete
MRVILKIKEDNFKNKDLVPRSFGAEVKGDKVLTIKTKWYGRSRLFNYDVKKICFTDACLLLEGIISDEKQLIGRCVFSVNDSLSHTTTS